MNKNKQISVTKTPLMTNPSENSSIETECLFGEKVNILKEYKYWSYCKCEIDNYKGYLNNSHLSKIYSNPKTISKKITLLFEKPDIKSKIIGNLFLNSKVLVKEDKGEWLEIFITSLTTAFIFKDHTKIIKNTQIKWISLLKTFLDSPYKWGGKTVLGIDCSGLTQTSLQPFNIFIPRNSNQQLVFKSPYIKDVKEIERGCLIFWKNHVAISISNNKIIHSNAKTMSVCIESFKAARKRISKTYGEVLKIRKVII